MKQTYIDLRNSKQLRWWGTYASKLVDIKEFIRVNSTEYGFDGYIVSLGKGIFTDYVISENEVFRTIK